jgi:NAD(P)-dependent dehydrogenase (short-subunit alcohol dehydrogenase family)
MDAKHKTILITGSTDGVGRRVAERLGAAGATILIHGRDAERAASLKATIERAGGEAAVYLADFSSLEAVRALAEAVARDRPRLDVLINNAGIGVGGPGARRETSRDGCELRFAVNYLAGFLLTRLLLPRVVAARGRIVNVASIGQQAIDFDEVMLTRGYSGRRAYCQSKLAEIMFAFDLAEELEGAGVAVNALHPATYMDTTMARRDGVEPLSSVDEGAEAILRLAVAPLGEGENGRYYDGLRPARANPQAYDADARARLRALSLALAGLEPSSAAQP